MDKKIELLEKVKEYLLAKAEEILQGKEEPLIKISEGYYLTCPKCYKGSIITESELKSRPSQKNGWETSYNMECPECGHTFWTKSGRIYIGNQGLIESSGSSDEDFIVYGVINPNQYPNLEKLQIKKISEFSLYDFFLFKENLKLEHYRSTTEDNTAYNKLNLDLKKSNDGILEKEFESLKENVIWNTETLLTKDKETLLYLLIRQTPALLNKFKDEDAKSTVVKILKEAVLFDSVNTNKIMAHQIKMLFNKKGEFVLPLSVLKQCKNTNSMDVWRKFFKTNKTTNEAKMLEYVNALSCVDTKLVKPLKKILKNNYPLKEAVSKICLYSIFSGIELDKAATIVASYIETATNKKFPLRENFEQVSISEMMSVAQINHNWDAKAIEYTIDCLKKGSTDYENYIYKKVIYDEYKNALENQECEETVFLDNGDMVTLITDVEEYLNICRSVYASHSTLKDLIKSNIVHLYKSEAELLYYIINSKGEILIERRPNTK